MWFGVFEQEEIKNKTIKYRIKQIEKKYIPFISRNLGLVADDIRPLILKSGKQYSKKNYNYIKKIIILINHQ